MKKAILLLSGGLDSATTAAILANENYEIFALSFDYNQRHQLELASAKKIVKFLDILHHNIIKIDSTIFQNSALTNNIEVPKNQDINPDKIPVTYVPARNILFLSYATAYAESLAINEIYIGANAIDYSGYPDCREETMTALQSAIRFGMESELTIHAPLMNFSKKQTVELALDLAALPAMALTHTCYNGVRPPCGSCPACELRIKGFREAGVVDPLTL